MIYIYKKEFASAYDILNHRQRQAVEHIYGPIMVIAGPGTGKTQLLAVRIGNILQKTDTDIRNILALTFTDNGSQEMRDRLRKFIGPQAYNSNIYTYHAFANNIIQSNPSYFGYVHDLQQVSDLERIDVFRKIIDNWPVDHPLKRHKGNVYYDIPRLVNLFDVMKRERWTPDTFQTAFDNLEQYYKNPENPEYQEYHYKRKTTRDGITFEKGDFNIAKFEKQIAKYKDVVIASKDVENYNRLLIESNRYDYNDMILWVIDAFKNIPDLLAEYQEKYQFILVDEFQDTNGAQNELLFLLTNNNVNIEPNIFVVGDDDQAIFRFQGANMENILDFEKKYAPTKIVLTANYRSYQNILNLAHTLIQHNRRRLSTIDSQLDKKIIAKHPLRQKKSVANIRCLRFANESQEELGIIQEILKLIHSGVSPEKIAIIYRSHKHIANIATYFSSRGIPINLKKKENVLEQILTKHILTILKYINQEYKDPLSKEDPLLFEMMHFPYFNISPIDAALVSIYCSQYSDDPSDDKKWRIVIGNKEELQNAKVNNIQSVLNFSTLVESWIGLVPNLTIQSLIEQIINQGNILESIIIGNDKRWNVQVLNSFLDFVQEEANKQTNFTLSALIVLIDKMVSENIIIPIMKIISGTKGIFLTTAHSSKGLEFDYVYIIRSNQQDWITNKGNSRFYSLPPNVNLSSQIGDIEDERRLFYVAITRAKTNLTISYSQQKNDGKLLEPVAFVSEIFDESKIETSTINEESIENYCIELFKKSHSIDNHIDKKIIDQFLQSFSMSPTNLNKYLKCPLAFYYERILRVPTIQSKDMGYGNAIHYALEQFFILKQNHSESAVPPIDKLLFFFYKGLKKYHSHFTKNEFEVIKHKGAIVLKDYYNDNETQWKLPLFHEIEYKIVTEHKGLPITGNIDRIDVLRDHIEIIDYKTRKYSSKSIARPKDEKIGGDYWRQMVFYKILLKNNSQYSGKKSKGFMSFMEPDNNGKYHHKKDVFITNEDVDFVSNQIVQTFENIRNYKFDNGCNEEYCSWCNMHKRK